MSSIRYKQENKKIIFSVFNLTLVMFIWHLSTFSALAGDELSFSGAPLFDDPKFFPIGVWLQQPKHAAQYKGLGVNLYVGLWKGPTPQQLAQLKHAAMPVISSQNHTGLTDRNREIIVGWLQDDEPDNAQKRESGWGYDAPIPPSVVIEQYKTLRANNPTKPVLLNLGQGVAWDYWKGRGERTNHPEDYREYVKGGDIVSFDIYPVTHSHPLVAGRLDFVVKGVRRLKKWVSKGQRIWNVIGASRIGNPNIMPTPMQIRSQVWLSIIHGSRGIIYFVHQFKPQFKEASILADPPLSDAVRIINFRIQNLAAVINGPDTEDLLTITTAPKAAYIATTTRRSDCYLYIFTSSLHTNEAAATFTLRYAAHDQKIKVLDENRQVDLVAGKFIDDFGAYGTHLYKIATSRPCDR